MMLCCVCLITLTAVLLNVLESSTILMAVLLATPLQTLCTGTEAHKWFVSTEETTQSLLSEGTDVTYLTPVELLEASPFTS